MSRSCDSNMNLPSPRLIDELSLHNRALSATEIAYIYDAGSAGKCKQPVIALQAQSQPAGTLTFSWAAFAGKAYQLQFKTNLAVGDWNDLGLPITATNNTASASDTIGSDVASIAWYSLREKHLNCEARFGAQRIFATNLHLHLRPTAPGTERFRLLRKWGISPSITPGYTGVHIWGARDLVLQT